jgi:hypothetical protein
MTDRTEGTDNGQQAKPDNSAADNLSLGYWLSAERFL